MQVEFGPFPRHIIRLLERLSIPYVVTGSMASSNYGKGRSTEDTDIVIDPSVEQLHALVRELEQDSTADWITAEDALLHRSMFNIISFDTVEKVDLILLRDEEYEKQAFGRRTTIDIAGFPVQLLSPEDSVLSKLVWCRESESTLQLEDVASVMAVQWKNLDWPYVEHWVQKLGIERGFEQARQEAESRLKY